MSAVILVEAETCTGGRPAHSWVLTEALHGSAKHNHELMLPTAGALR